MSKNRGLVLAGKGVLKTITPLVDELFLAFETQEEEKISSAAKAFTVAILCLTEQYFSEANWALHRWLENRTLPEVADNVELVKAGKKLDRKLKRMEGKKYKKRFYFEWNEDVEFEGRIIARPRREFNSERYDAEWNKVFEAIESVKRRVEKDRDNQIADKLEKELEGLFGNILYCFDTVFEMGKRALPPAPGLESGEISGPERYFCGSSQIILTANVEHLIPFLKRACSLLEVQAKKHGRWDEKELALGRFLLSLKERAAEYGGELFNKDQLTAVYDGVMAVELFLAETYNAIVRRRKEIETQKELQQTLRSGFANLTERLSGIEQGVTSTNKHLAGIDGRLVDILRVNKDISRGVEKNGLRLEGVSAQLGSINKRLDSMMDFMVACHLEELTSGAD